VNKHTPAPWSIERVNGSSRVFIERDGGDFLNKLIAAVMSDNRDEPHMANARLIAAAPDLLAALEAIVSADARGELCHDEIALAVEAITKATGQP
jgi:hypothetical protein